MKKERVFVALLIPILMLSLVSSDALCFETLNDHHLTGSSQILYYIDSSALEYKESIMYGFQYWNGHVSGVSCWRTYTKSYSRCDAYWGDYDIDRDGWIAVTYFYLNNEQIWPFDTDWYWCQVYFTSTRFSYTGLTYQNRRGTACHEMGHVWGLYHSSRATDVMCIYDNGRTAYQPSSDDIAGIAYLY